ncbi:MAG: S9 family peptidase [Terrimesophilobacter sp.]
MNYLDLPLLTSLSRPTFHPDGTWAVVATSRPNLDADASVGQLWRIAVDHGSRAKRGAPVRITQGFNDSSPRFSPDGTRIAFLRSDGETPPQLHVMPATGGEPVRATDQKLGVSSFEWSPDGVSLAYTARVAEEGRYGTVKDLGPSAEPPRRIVTRNYQYNGLGYTNDRRTHVFLVEAPDTSGEPTYRRAPSATEPTPEPHPSVPESRQLTDGDYDHSSPRFALSGDRIAFLSARHANRDIDLANNVYELDLSSSDAAPTALINNDHNFGVEGFVYRDDSSIWFIGTDLGVTARDFVGRNGALFHLDLSNGAATKLTDPEMTDLSEGASEVQLALDGSVLALNRWHGSVELVSITPAGEFTTLAAAPIVVGGFDTAAGTVMVSFSGPTTHGDVAVVVESGLDVLTDFSAPLVSAGITSIDELIVTAKDGQAIQGWVLTPEGEGPHPVLLNIHGGPYAQYTCAFFDEAQVYANAGYAVVMCNPRGAAGYGESFGRAIRHQMGTLDFTDVLDFLDGALAAHPSFDAKRLGIMGGSYGGYLTAWAIAQDHRFAGAIVERGFLDPVTFVGTSDIGDFFSDEYTGTDTAQIEAQSPQAFVHQVTTPTLVLHSEQDLRCPLSQAERYYLALKRQGVEAELLIFPGENHELSRSGRPRHRVQRFEAILDWWQRHLPVTRRVD